MKILAPVVGLIFGVYLLVNSRSFSRRALNQVVSAERLRGSHHEALRRKLAHVTVVVIGAASIVLALIAIVLQR